MKVNARSTKTVPLQEAINSFLESFNLTAKYNEAQLVSSWDKIMGKAIANRTESIYIKNGILYLKISSAPLRQELSLAKSKLIKLINEEMGKSLIDEVLFF